MKTRIIQQKIKRVRFSRLQGLFNFVIAGCLISSTVTNNSVTRISFAEPTLLKYILYVLANKTPCHIKCISLLKYKHPLFLIQDTNILHGTC